MKEKTAKKSNIALIGFMFTGKTCTGRLIAKKLGKKFVELDSVITEMADKSIEQIFAEDGELRFRELEMQAVEKASHMKDAVISCGGGVILNKINIDRLKNSSKVVLLTATKEVILERANKERAAKQTVRPVLNMARKNNKIDELIAFRKPLYEAYSDFAIDTTNFTEEEVAMKIIKKL